MYQQAYQIRIDGRDYTYRKQSITIDDLRTVPNPDIGDPQIQPGSDIYVTLPGEPARKMQDGESIRWPDQAEFRTI